MQTLKQLTIKNFQSHKHSVIDLSNGLNVFMGQSRQGKTASVRALRWVVQNQPQGTAFIRSGETDCEVTVETAEGEVIVRKRTPSFNGYIVNGKELKAMKSQVPEEVRAVLGMTDLNWQFEHDGPFLLNETSGEVARRLNEIADLNDIDICLGNFSTWVRQERQTAKHLEEELENTLLELNGYNYLPNMKEDLDSLTLLEEKNSSRRAQISKLSECRNDLDELFPGIFRCQKILRGKDSLERLVEEETRLKDNCSKINRLADILEGVDDIDDELEKIPHHDTIQSCLTEVYDLETSATILANLSQQTEQLGKIISQVKQVVQEEKGSAERLRKLQDEMPEKCPTCGTLLQPKGD
jgi:DNA repair protein SbcC/Rad50